MQRVWFITGTDTGVGKTLLTSFLTLYLRTRHPRVLALKPFCTGGREDAEILFQAQDGRIPLDEINPWHFRPPLAPWVAAQRSHRRVTLAQTIKCLRQARRRSDVLLIEGAGGLLTPLGDRFCAADLIRELRAMPLVVCLNRLGVINQARLVFSALPGHAASRCRLVLMEPPVPDASCRSNPGVLASFVGAGRVHRFPWLPRGIRTPLDRRLERRLARLLA